MMLHCVIEIRTQFWNDKVAYREVPFQAADGSSEAPEKEPHHHPRAPSLCCVG